jgi:hypothetical protein
MPLLKHLFPSLQYSAGFFRHKKREEEDAVFCLIKDGIFLPLSLNSHFPSSTDAYAF